MICSEMGDALVAAPSVSSGSRERKSDTAGLDPSRTAWRKETKKASQARGGKREKNQPGEDGSE